MRHSVILVLLLLALPVRAENFTTAAEVRPLLTATRASWVAVREYDGNDLLYFTNLLAWRCGVDSIRYSVNGGGEQSFPMEPCYEGEAVPNAIKGADIYVTLPPGTVNSVSVTLVFDDGTRDSAQFERQSILLP